MQENPCSITFTADSTDFLDSRIAALLRGEKTIGEFPTDAENQDGLYQRICFHGVETLLFANKDALAQLPGALASRLQLLARACAVRELRQRHLLFSLCEAFAAAGIDLLVFKGAAVAYTLYENPVHRTRSDIDLLIKPADLDKAGSILSQLGYSTDDPDTVVTYVESGWWIEAPEGGRHHIDLHWQLNNSALLASLYCFEELYQRSIALPIYGQAARTPGYSDTLLIACLHRKAHEGSGYTVNDITYTSGERLIWLYDIDKLARLLSSAQWAELVQLTLGKGAINTLCGALTQAAQVLGTPLPGHWRADADQHLVTRGAAPSTIVEESALISCYCPEQRQEGTGRADGYFAAGLFQRFWLDLCACSGVKAGMQFISTLLFPGAGYMRGKYPASRAWLPWLYARRICTGFWQRVKGKQAD